MLFLRTKNSCSPINTGVIRYEINSNLFLTCPDANSEVATQYDAADRITQTDTTTSAGSHRLQYAYDSLDIITTRTLSGTGITAPEVSTYSWDLAGKLLSHSTTVSGQLHATSYSYDNAARLNTRGA